MCDRLTSVYGGPCNVTGVEPDPERDGYYLVRFSASWGEKSIIRTMRLQVDIETGEVPFSEILEKDYGE